MDRLPTQYEIKKQREKKTKQMIAYTCIAIVIVSVSLLLIG